VQLYLSISDKFAKYKYRKYQKKYTHFKGYLCITVYIFWHSLYMDVNINYDNLGRAEHPYVLIIHYEIIPKSSLASLCTSRWS
jgi:hypothetical protein